MNAPCSGAPLTAPHVTTGGLCRWKAINKEGRHVGLDFYDLLIEGAYTQNRIAGEIANNPPGQQLPGEHSSPEAGSQHCPLVGTVCAMEKLHSAPLARTSIEEHATEAKTEYRTEQCRGEHGAG